MCEYYGGGKKDHGSGENLSSFKSFDISALMPFARFLCAEEGLRRTAVGFIGYSGAGKGDKVLIAVDSHYDPFIAESIARALREKGAKADILVVDVGPDRPFDEFDEIRVVIRRGPSRFDPRRWEGTRWVEELAEKNGYRLLIHGRGGGIPPTPYHYEPIPWQVLEQFASPATTYPRELQRLINTRSWEPIWKKGKGGKIHVTDPEGTDLSYTLWDDFFTGEWFAFNATPFWGHLMSHPWTPILEKEDASGVVCGTTSHYSKPFPRIKVTIERGKVEKVEGGGKYGDGWRELLDETGQIQYPSFPRKGLFWLWEVAIGTNPKVARPTNIHMLASGGAEWERRRSGIIHLGFGTAWRAHEEDWAAEKGIAYGHLHVHLLFPTIELITKRGDKIPIIENGHLLALDDPEVRGIASKYGDPDELLKEDWIPLVPGISAPGSYEDYARNPLPWVYPS
ncbi:MAG: hypothetical protein HY694_00230 [Deltaproteobacteria bacterium]|nr:hypothetical protein [Deltaproteobacteria bacterium]